MAQPSSALIYKKDQLHFNHYSLSQLAEAYPTPFFLYSESILKENFFSFLDAAKKVGFENPLICFAMKANSNQKMIHALGNWGSGADIVSGGELRRALESGITPDKIVFSGVGKTAEELQYALEKNIFSFNIESIEELELLHELAKTKQVKARVAFRLNPTVKPKTHKYISTGNKTHKFGLLLSDVRKALKRKELWQWCELKGLSIHIGSQLLDLKATYQAIKIMGEFALTCPPLEFLDVGGGLGVDYHPNETKNLPTTLKYMQTVRKALDDSYLKKRSLKDTRIVFEPGRRIVAKCGILVMKVLRSKKSEKFHFTIVDGGMNDFMRPSLYEAYHGLLPLKKAKSSMVTTVVGPICETSDCFGHQRKMSKVKTGDFICLADAGAYGFSMGSNYNLRGKPAELMLNLKGEILIINQRQEFSELK
jgi:diaminopimelate decarboxylase